MLAGKMTSPCRKRQPDLMAHLISVAIESGMDRFLAGEAFEPAHRDGAPTAPAAEENGCSGSGRRMNRGR